MKPDEYKTLASYEGWYWWYLAQRAALVETVRELPLGEGARVLDAGCGTGCNMHALHEETHAQTYGVDLSEHACALWTRDRTLARSRGTINDLPFADAAFDAVVSVDVLCCREVEPTRSLREMSRVLVQGGYLVLMVPAFQWLLSEHDDAVHCVRRFDRPQLRSLMQTTGLEVRRMTYLFPTFFPALAAIRLIGKLRRSQRSVPAQSDLSPLPSWINGALLAVAGAERRITRRVPSSIGSTILTVARKGQP